MHDANVLKFGVWTYCTYKEWLGVIAPIRFPFAHVPKEQFVRERPAAITDCKVFVRVTLMLLDI